MGIRWTEKDLAKIGVRVSKKGTELSKNDTNLPDSGTKPRKVKRGPSANALTKEALYLLKAAGYEAWRNNNNGVWDPNKKIFRRNSTKRGVPDIIGYHRKTGQACWVEIKAGKDKLSTEQTRFLEEARTAGCLAVEYRGPDDLALQIEKYIKH